MSNSGKKFDHIIIGQGLAGSILAYRLMQSGQSILVIDNNLHGSSSKVAAGIINPITGYRLTTNNLFAEQQNISYAFYQEVEKLFSTTFLVHLDQYRLLKSDEQVAYWNKRSRHENYAAFVGQHLEQHQVFQPNEFGVVEIKKSARVYVSVLLDSLKAWFIEKNAYLNQKIDYADISLTEHHVQLGNISAKNLIFCEGFQAMHNPWWQHLPFKLSKGEILTLKLSKPIDALYNWRQWIIPNTGTHSDLALLGANYQWGNFNEVSALAPTETARDYLLMRLESNTQISAAVIEHKAGIRPTPTHRFPYIGAHKNHKNIFCFNGFGSKGCVTIPYYSQLLLERLLMNKPLPHELTQWL